MTVRHKDQVLGLELRVAQALCESIGSPRALTVSLLIRSGEWKQLLDLKVDPNDYFDYRSFEGDYLVTSVLQKNPRLPTGIDTDKVALEKFLDWEAECSRTNDRISGFVEGRVLPDSDVGSCLAKAQAHIQRILGPLTRSKLSFAEANMRFGPGATTSLSGVVTQGKKYSRRTLDATPRVLPFRAFGFPVEWRPFASEISLRRASKVRIVPKNAKTGRTICIEPDLNIFVQLGAGALLRDRLARVGLDLSTQSWNQYLAKRAWELDLTTMDLSGASDSICREVVWLLLPFEWADFLHFSRVDFTQLPDGKEIELNKWSSMGNGYTFELETLLFYGIILGALEELGVDSTFVACYGDDLIFPSTARSLIERTLEFLGFRVNRDKTFGKGVFHESCGTDWFMGHNVRPVFFRTEHHDFPTVCYVIANSLTSLSIRHTTDGSRDARFLPGWIRSFTACPAEARHRIPLGYGDVGFVESFDRATPSTRFAGRGWSGYDFSYRSCRPITSRISEQGCLLAFLNGTITEFSLARESLRGRFRKAATSRGYVLTWPHLGPWR